MDMENENNQWLLQPLIIPLVTISTSATSTQSPTTTQYKVVSNNNSSLFLRLLFVLFIGLISLWANHEASRFFDITIVNEFGHTPSGKLFNLRFVSNGKASNMILEATQSIGSRLFPNNNHDNSFMKKLISRVTLRAVDDNLTDSVVAVDFGDREFGIKIRLSVLEAKNAEMAMGSALRRGMARVWLWGIVGAVEYNSSGWVWFGDRNLRVLGHLLSRCEKKNEGFVEQLVDRIAKDQWREGEELLERCNDSIKIM